MLSVSNIYSDQWGFQFVFKIRSTVLVMAAEYLASLQRHSRQVTNQIIA